MLYFPKHCTQETSISIPVAAQPAAGRIFTRSFLFLLVGAFSFYASMWLVALQLPSYTLKLGGSESQVGLVLSAFAFTALLSRPAVGRLVDTLGRRLVAVAGCVVFALAPLLYLMSPTVPALLLARMFHGLGISLFGTAGMTWVADMVPPTRRAEAMGIYSNTSQVAIALGPILGTLLHGMGGYGVLFPAAGAVGLLSVVLVSRAREEKRDRSAAASRGGFGLALGRRDVLAMTFALLTGAATWGILTGFLPIFIVQRQAGSSAPFFTIYAIATITLRLIVGPMADRIGRRVIAAPALALLAATMVAFNLVWSMPALYTLAVIYGVSFGTLFPMLSAYLVDVAPAHVRGSAVGVLTAGFDLGIMVGAYGGGVVAEYLGLGAAFTASGVLCMIGVVIFWLGTPAKRPV